MLIDHTVGFGGWVDGWNGAAYHISTKFFTEMDEIDTGLAALVEYLLSVRKVYCSNQASIKNLNRSLFNGSKVQK